MNRRPEGFMARCLLFILPLLLSVLSAEADTIPLGGRSYEVVLPANPDGAPLIVALHGGGGSPGKFARSTGLGRMAAQAGYVVIFPAGTGRRDRLTWNAGYCCGLAARKGTDDETFLRQVIADAEARFGIDPARVYLTGMSNGSMLAETFAARNPGLVRAVAGVSGPMDTGAVRVAGKVPALIIHGTADRNVPYEGGQGEASRSGTRYASVAAVVGAFLAPWGAGGEPRPRDH
ncbi:MAG: hypothetical protein B7Z31_05055 [Rhodobacterales bacterium 12-65-15]|nr:MAG: hypothetical protein B7Z31_05055 [Rhodobacterales bacterium 12-65-15]